MTFKHNNYSFQVLIAPNTIINLVADKPNPTITEVQELLSSRYPQYADIPANKITLRKAFKG